jgi:hypothetical protein
MNEDTTIPSWFSEAGSGVPSSPVHTRADDHVVFMKSERA